jgi:ABC-type cobalamin/Fe3+-siderophores transport system ATPase subunit
MVGSVRLFDYRCFRREAPATLPVSSGFTAFIGPNNAGKSALIRSLFELRTAFGNLLQLGTNPNNLVLNPQGFGAPPPMYDTAEIVCDREGPQCSVDVLPDPWSDATPLEIGRVNLAFSENAGQYVVRIFGSDSCEICIPNSTTAFATYDKDGLVISDGRRYDTRSFMRFVDVVARIQFVGPFRNAINEGAGGHFDAQVGTGFIAQWHSWKTGASKAQNRAIQRVTEDVRRLIGARSLEVSASIELKTLQVVVDGRPHKLQELGSGIAQMIVVLGSALIRQPSFVVIDEPEIHLHPGLQTEFLMALASYAQLGVMYATHSIGLARATSDHCFSVQKSGAGSIVRPFERTPHYAEFLGSLGIAGLQEIGWDRILLVEGPKDVRTFQNLLRLYDMDRRTVVLPLGGDSMANGVVGPELSEILRLTSNVAAIVDSERKSATDQPIQARRDFAAVCASLKINCCITERRAIENYLSESAIAQAFGGRCKPLGPYAAPGESGVFWGKGESWRAAKLMTRTELDATDIGQFLAALQSV